jgi:hypothetical protein
MNENITSATPKNTELMPFGRKPPCSTRLVVPGDSTPGIRPKIIAPPRIKNKARLTTFIRENQYSNSPNDLTEYTFVRVNKKVRMRLIVQEGMPGNQY